MHRLCGFLCRLVLVGLMAVGTAVVCSVTLSGAPPAAGAVPADTVHGGYPDWNAPCSHTSSPNGPCSQFDWGYQNSAGKWSIYSPRTYGYRNCTDWAAWHLESDYGVPKALIDSLGNAGWWSGLSTHPDAVAYRTKNRSVQSRGVTVDSTPAVGAAVATRTPGDAAFGTTSYYGHVAVIDAINGNQITVSEYNKNTLGTYQTRTNTWSNLGFTDVIHFEKFATKGLPAPVTKPAQPGKPSLSQSGTSTTLNVSWPAVSGASQYHVQWSTNGGRSWTSGPTVSSTSTSFSGGYGQTYLVQVQAGNTAGWGAYSAYSSAVTLKSPPPKPAQPGRPTVTQSGTSTTLNVSWPAVSGATQYHLQWSDNGGASWTSGPTGSATSASFTGNYGHTYVAQVQAGNSSGWGSYSAYSTATTVKSPPPPPKPGQPGKPSLSQSGTSTTLNISWPGVPGATQYHVQWSSNGGSSWTSGPTVSGTSVSFTGGYGQSYVVQVQAGNSSGWGSYSAYSNFVTVSRPTTTAILKYGMMTGHTGPGDNYAQGPSHAQGSSIGIVCYATGSLPKYFPSAAAGKSWWLGDNRWDLATDGYYYADAWLSTNGSSRYVTETHC